ncbi:MAG: UDP-N-acetylglucosamine 1-carboxyvinyltransferase, partial [Anaerotignum sp.]|nr:UDP-N-acetylglucosamine 1-carboxyvinyltransferase [Anaerotignum sp.]
MGMYIVQGGRRIEGEFCVRGSKNASLPILAACILAEDEVVLENLPFIRDVLQTLDILKELGCRVEVYGRTAVIDSSSLKKTDIDNDTVRKMRSSILFLGALLGREKEAKLACPGGCAIGRRPIDLHLAAFERMGAVFQKEGEMLSCRAE